jgi:hypothetical protein
MLLTSEKSTGQRGRVEAASFAISIRPGRRLAHDQEPAPREAEEEWLGNGRPAALDHPP